MTPRAHPCPAQGPWRLGRRNGEKSRRLALFLLGDDGRIVGAWCDMKHHDQIQAEELFRQHPWAPAAPNQRWPVDAQVKEKTAAAAAAAAAADDW